MKRWVLLALVVVFTFAVLNISTSTQNASAEKLWTLKYQILAPHHFVVEKIVPVPNPKDPKTPKLKKVYEKYWYQVLYLKNPIKEKITVPFNCVLLVDTVEKVRCPVSGEMIDVSNLMPGFANEGPNYVYSEKGKVKVRIPGTAHMPIFEPVVREKIIKKISVTKVRKQKYTETFRNSEVLTTRPLPKYYDYLSMTEPFNSEELRQVILIYKDLAPSFDRLIFRFGGLTNEYVKKTDEDEKVTVLKKLLRIEYTRPGDGFSSDDTNPAEVDLFHLESNEWILEPVL